MHKCHCSLPIFSIAGVQLLIADFYSLHECHHLYSISRECHCWLPIFSIARVPLLIAYFLYCKSAIVDFLFPLLRECHHLVPFFYSLFSPNFYFLQVGHCWLPIFYIADLSLLLTIFCSRSSTVDCRLFCIAIEPLMFAHFIYSNSAIVYCSMFSIAVVSLFIVIFSLLQVRHYDCPLFFMSLVPLVIVLCSILQVCHCSLPSCHQWSALMLITESMTYVHLGKTQSFSIPAIGMIVYAWRGRISCFYQHS